MDNTNQADQANRAARSCAGKVAIVTGAAGSGIGRSTALTLAREGARVVVNYRTSQAAAEQLVTQIEAAGGQALAVQADIFEAQACKTLVDTAAGWISV